MSPTSDDEFRSFQPKLILGLKDHSELLNMFLEGGKRYGPENVPSTSVYLSMFPMSLSLSLTLSLSFSPSLFLSLSLSLPLSLSLSLSGYSGPRDSSKTGHLLRRRKRPNPDSRQNGGDAEPMSAASSRRGK